MLDLALAIGSVATRPSGAGGPTIGPELVTNGGFAADTNWTKGTGETISGGVLNCNQAGASNLASQSITLSAGTYRVVFTVVSFTSGTINPAFSVGQAVNGTARSAAGTYTQDLTTTGSFTFGLSCGAGGFVGTVDDVSCKKIG